MSSKHRPHGETVRWPTPNRRALATRRRELEDALLAEERRYADAHIDERPMATRSAFASASDAKAFTDAVRRAIKNAHKDG